MERQEYLQRCQNASIKCGRFSAWWQMHWEDNDLVTYRGDRYIPYDYRFGFENGRVSHIAILRSPKTNSVTEAKLAEVKNE